MLYMKLIFVYNSLFTIYQYDSCTKYVFIITYLLNIYILRNERIFRLMNMNTCLTLSNENLNTASVLLKNISTYNTLILYTQTKLYFL